MLDTLQGRNGSGEFARRAMSNLEFVLSHSAADIQVHPITQIICTLLGVVVFPWERSAFDKIKNKRVAAAISEGWPAWMMSGSRIDGNKVSRIGDLIGLVRNSISHGHVLFDSDSRLPHDVTITFENRPRGGRSSDWQGRIRADCLALFCHRFCAFVSDHVS